ncbi:MAG: hypothetical protein KGY70_16035 [Bacteroidales bacterium]|nr:hypothetical protein [Bacteroidales bacterium]
MKAFEFKSKLKNKSIIVPDNLSSKLSGKKEIRVIILYEEEENQDENDFQNIAREQFLAGYSESDSIYDDE